MPWRNCKGLLRRPRSMRASRRAYAPVPADSYSNRAENCPCRSGQNESLRQYLKGEDAMRERSAIQSAALQDLKEAHFSALSIWQAIKHALETAQNRREERLRLLNGYIARADTVAGESAAIITAEFERLEREGEAGSKVISALMVAEAEARGEVLRLTQAVADRM